MSAHSSSLPPSISSVIANQRIGFRRVDTFPFDCHPFRHNSEPDLLDAKARLQLKLTIIKVRVELKLLVLRSLALVLLGSCPVFFYVNTDQVRGQRGKNGTIETASSCGIYVAKKRRGAIS